MSASKAQRIATHFNYLLYRAKGTFKATELMARHIGMYGRAEDIEIIGQDVVQKIELQRNRLLLECKPIIVVTGIKFYSDRIATGTAPNNNGKRIKKTIKLKNVLRCWHCGEEYLELETRSRRYLLTLTSAQRRGVLSLFRRLGTPTPWKFDL